MDTNTILSQIDVVAIIQNPQVGIVPMLLFIGYILKNTSGIKNEFIPFILMFLGILGGLAFVSLDLNGGFIGLVYSALAVLPHVLYKQAAKLSDKDKQ